MKITEKTKPNKVIKKIDNNWQKFTATELKDVVVNVNKLKTDTAKYSSEGLAKNVPLVKSIQSFRNKLRLFAKYVLRVNDVEDYISKNWNRKNIRKQIFDNINYSEKLKPGIIIASFSKNDPDLTRSRFLDMSTLRYATSFRLLKIRQALVDGMTIENIYQQTKIDPWFLNQIKSLSNYRKVCLN